jgi:predicted transcriptional regulator
MSDDIGVPLKSFCSGRTQSQVASLIGVTQGSISQMINSARDIRVQQLAEGEYKAVELVPVGRKRAA